MKNPNQTAKLDLWLVNPASVTRAQAHRFAHEQLSAAERERVQRFISDELKHNFIVARALVRQALTRHVGGQVAPQDWTFGENAYGRPEVLNNGYRSGLFFNLSHTNGLAGCLVGPAYEIGLDLEDVRRKVNYMDLGLSSFAPEEIEDLRRRELHQRAECFFTYWTLKESYIKARGMGLSLPLEQFTFRLGKTIAVDIASALQDRGESWRFAMLKPTPTHIVAVGAKLDQMQVDCRWLSDLAS